MAAESALMETYMVVSLGFAVFAAVTAVGTSLVLGVGYERIRNGLDQVKEGLDLVNKQTGYFADAIFKIDRKVADLDQGQQELMSMGVQEAQRAESLVNHAESLLNQARHEGRREVEVENIFEKLSVNDDSHKVRVSRSQMSDDKKDDQVRLKILGDSVDQVRFM